MPRESLRKVSSLLLILCLSSQAAAECDFATVEKLQDGRYSYSLECHRKVGKLVADVKDREEQVVQKDVQIRNLGVQIETHEKRAALWMDTSFKMEERVNQIERIKSTNQWLYFCLGVLTTGIAVWGAGHLKP